MRNVHRWCFALVGALCLASCTSDYTLEDQYRESLTRATTERTYIKDAKGRYIFLHGLNVSGSSKFPVENGNTFTYVGKPFPLDEADHHFDIIQKLGFNAIRLVIMWEAIEPEARGQYDTEYLEYLEKIVSKANEHGIYVLLDMHEDMFSRHLYALYNDTVVSEGAFDLEAMLLAILLPPNNRIMGDGAPKWAVRLCLPEKNLDSPDWGKFPLFVSDPRNTNDMYPFTYWGTNSAISVSVERCFASFFAGDTVYPQYKVGGQSIKDYLQDAYTDSWRQVAMRVKDYPNVIGYDVINEPVGYFFIFAAYAFLYREVEANGFQPISEDQASAVVKKMLDEFVTRGFDAEMAANILKYLIRFQRLPTSREALAQEGFPAPGDAASAAYAPNISAAININSDFNRNYLQPLHKKVGEAIQEIDPDAIIWIEQALGLGDGGLLGQWIAPMTRPPTLNHVVFSPHFYTDIYPYLGFVEPPRNFTVDEIKYRSYLDQIQSTLSLVTLSLGNIPAAMGEFGTYFNFNGIDNAIAANYDVSANILDNYYEDFEKIFLSHFEWCYSAENTKENGDGWNKEDFSLLGPDGVPRAEMAYSRPFPRFSSGKPVSMHFYSDFHYYDPTQFVPDPVHEFVFSFETRETDEPTEIFVPPVQYPDGFYVYLSDGYAHYDPSRTILYFHPVKVDPGTVHTLRMRPPYDDYGDDDWDYFFRDDLVLTNAKP